MFKNEQPKLKS